MFSSNRPSPLTVAAVSAALLLTYCIFQETASATLESLGVGGAGLDITRAAVPDQDLSDIYNSTLGVCRTGPELIVSGQSEIQQQALTTTCSISSSKGYSSLVCHIEQTGETALRLRQQTPTSSLSFGMASRGRESVTSQSLRTPSMKC